MKKKPKQKQPDYFVFNYSKGSLYYYGKKQTLMVWINSLIKVVGADSRLINIKTKERIDFNG